MACDRNAVEECFSTCSHVAGERRQMAGTRTRLGKGELEEGANSDRTLPFVRNNLAASGNLFYLKSIIKGGRVRQTTAPRINDRRSQTASE